MKKIFLVSLITICSSYLNAQFNNGANILLNNGQYVQFKNSSGNAQAGVLHVSAGNEVFIGDIHNWLGGRLNLRTTGVDRITITPTGQVGIGKIDPVSTLHINAPLSGISSMSFGAANASGNLLVPHLASPGGYNIDFYTWRDVRPDQIGARIRAERINLHENNNALVQAMDLVFSTSDGFDQLNLAERLRVKYNGNVGIGTSNPTEKLVVSFGTAVIQSLSTTSVNTPAINSLGSGLRLGWGSSSAGPTLRVLHGGDYNNAGIGISTWSGGIEKESIRIMSNGNVGIGTNNPGTMKLAVEGNLGARKMIVTQAVAWPDYVFHPTYELRSLSFLESYINNYGHLPEVPSAQDVEKNGLDIGLTQAALLKKIEELTLYVIEQGKQLQIQKAKIERIEKISKNQTIP